MEKVTIPRRAIRFNVTMQILRAAIVLLGAVNYFSFINWPRRFLTADQKLYSLDQTRRRARPAEAPTSSSAYHGCFSRDHSVRRVADPSAMCRNLLLESSHLLEPQNIKVEYVDQDSADPLPGARELQGKYQFTEQENVIILDYDGKGEVRSDGETPPGL